MSERSSRRRIAPKRLADEEMVHSTQKKRAATMASRPRAAKRDIYSEEHLTHNPKSKLVDIDLCRLLAKSQTLEVLDNENIAELQSLLPEHALTPTQDGIRSDFLLHDPDFKTAVRMYQEDLQQGRLDPEWQKQAAEAMEERANGDFDDFKAQEMEEFWGQRKLPPKSLAGLSSKIKLEVLVAEGVFEIGDIWKYKRTIWGTLVEKDATITAFGPKHTLTFSVPPGQHKFSTPNAGHEITISNIDGPTRLGNEILHIDGRITEIPNGSAWKEFYCFRKNENLGSIFEMRETFHRKKQAQN
ncbi:MAG: hypothetical protein M1819_004328 [Sarea resinae]|nr:MAG: hypothetical protein M1819_004328 [Sarea resinae]